MAKTMTYTWATPEAKKGDRVRVNLARLGECDGIVTGVRTHYDQDLQHFHLYDVLAGDGLTHVVKREDILTING